MSEISFELRPIPPFRLDLTVWTLRRRPSNLIDQWDGETYRRVLVVRNKPVVVTVRQVSRGVAPRLRVQASGTRLATETRAALTAALERLLGLRLNLTNLYRFAATDRHLGPLVARWRGMKPPRYATIFEGLVNAIACQQITLTQGITLLNRLTTEYGAAAQDGMGHAFPRPQDLVALEPARLRQLGFSQQKIRALVELSHGIVEGLIDLDSLRKLDNAAAVEYLCKLRGVGRWTAEYVLLRGLGRLDVFPGDDVGGRNNLQRWLGLKQPLDYAEVNAVVAQWQPYAGLVYLHSLLERIGEAGYVQHTTADGD